MPMLTTLRMRLPVWPFHVAAADAVGESGHFVEHGVDVGNDIFAIDHDGFALGRAQSNVQDRALFRDVDFLAAKHGVDAFAQAGFLASWSSSLAFPR